MWPTSRRRPALDARPRPLRARRDQRIRPRRRRAARLPPDPTSRLTSSAPCSDGRPGRSPQTAVRARRRSPQPTRGIRSSDRSARSPPTSGQVRFTRAWRVDPAGWQVAAQFDDGAPGGAGTRRGERTGGAVCVRPRSPLERFPAASVVRAVCRRDCPARRGAQRVEADEFVVGRTPAGVSARAGPAPACRTAACRRQCRCARVRHRRDDASGLRRRCSIRFPRRTATGGARGADRVPSEPVAVRIVPDAGDARGRVVHRESLMTTECRAARAAALGASADGGS